MFHPARLITALLVLVLALIGREVRAVMEEPEPGPAVSRAAVRHNTPVTEELTRRWRSLPQVTDAQAGYDGARRVVTAYAVCAPCNRENVASRLSRDVWWSDLQDVDRVRVMVALEDDRANPVVQEWDPVADAARLYDRYGNGMVDPDDVARD